MDIEDIIQVIFESIGEADADYDYGDMLNALVEQGVDLTQFSVEEIRGALDVALGEDVVDLENDVIDSDKRYNVAFVGSDRVNERNIASSQLQELLQKHHIYIPGAVYSDKFGGLSSFSGEKVEDAINAARNKGNISHEDYRYLLELLKKACRFQ